MKNTLIVLCVLLCSVSTGFGKTYKGKSSYYYRPQKTASGKYFYPHYMWCAHKTLPLGTVLKVTNPRTNKSVVVTVWDRGPYIKGRSLDLSRAAFAKIGDIKRGVINVTYEIIGRKK